ncbi:MAG: glycosyltransferase family protein [Pseudomonadota bacterium]
MLADPLNRTLVYVGSLSDGPDRDSGWVSAFTALGWDVIPFGSDVAVQGPRALRWLARRLHVGAAHRHMRAALVALCRSERPAWVHFRLPLAFTRADIEAIRSTGAIVTDYFNDDPFSPRRVPGLHRRFRRALPAYDAHFVYRRHNVDAYRAAGARHVEHCPPALDRVRLGSEAAAECVQPATGGFVADAAFLGHYEADGRLDAVRALDAAGFRVAVHGAGWTDALRAAGLTHLLPADPIFGAGYRQRYRDSIAGLCFFSRLNRDSWTERPLEIVAAGGALVCERSDEALGHFREGEEALFFSSPGELVDACRRLRDEAGLRERLVAGAAARLVAGRFDIADRARQVEAFVRTRLAR